MHQIELQSSKNPSRPKIPPESRVAHVSNGLPTLSNISNAVRDIEGAENLVVNRIPQEALSARFDELPRPQFDRNILHADAEVGFYIRELTNDGLAILLHILRTWKDIGGFAADQFANDTYPNQFIGASTFQRVVEKFAGLIQQLATSEQRIIGHDLYAMSVAVGPDALMRVLNLLEAGA